VLSILELICLSFFAGPHIARKIQLCSIAGNTVWSRVRTSIAIDMVLEGSAIGQESRYRGAHGRARTTEMCSQMQCKTGKDKLYYSHGNHWVNKLLNFFMNSYIIVRLRAICGLASLTGDRLESA